MKIAMLGHKRIPSREGGIEIVVEELARRMAVKGHQVTCYNRSGHHVSGREYDSTVSGKDRKSRNNPEKAIRISHRRGIQYADDTESADRGEVRIFTVPTINGKGLAAVSSSFFASIRAAFGKYDIVHVHAEGPCLFLWIPKLLRKRCIVTIHGLDWQREKWSHGIGSKLIKAGEKNAVHFADEIIVLSRQVQTYFYQTYGRDTVYIPNGVNRPVKVSADLITDRWNLYKDSYILFLGRLVPEKGIHYLIEAYNRLETDKKLVIAGGSSDTEDYARELQKLASVNKNILLTGFVDGQLLDELYSNAYLYCLPSDLEGMPLSLLEAMSYGNCCLASDIPECAEVTEDHGITFRKGDTANLTEKLQVLCNDERTVQKYQAEAADYICDKYGWDEVVEKTLELYRRGTK